MSGTAGLPSIIRRGLISAQPPELRASGSSPMSRLPLGASYDQSRASRNCCASSRPDHIAADRLDIAAIERIQYDWPNPIGAGGGDEAMRLRPHQLPADGRR